MVRYGTNLCHRFSWLINNWDEINVLTSKLILLGYRSIIRIGLTWNNLPLVNILVQEWECMLSEVVWRMTGNWVIQFHRRPRRRANVVNFIKSNVELSSPFHQTLLLQRWVELLQKCWLNQSLYGPSTSFQQIIEKLNVLYAFVVFR